MNLHYTFLLATYIFLIQPIMMIYNIANDDISVTAVTTFPSPSNDVISSLEDSKSK